MIGEDFLFDDVWLSDFGMKMYAPDETQQFTDRTIEKSEVTPQRQVPNHYTAYYPDALTLNFLIIRDECEYPRQEDKELIGEDINLLRAWLESPKTPTKLVIPMDIDEATTNYFGIFTSVQPYVVDHVCYGLNLTFTCNAPYGFSDEYKSIYKINASNAEINGRFVNLSAEYRDYMKPRITINSSGEFGDNEAITIRNLSDDSNEMRVSLPKGKKSVTIDCQKRTIVDENGKLLSMADIGLTIPVSDRYNFISAEMFMFYWLRLVPNENKLVFEGSKFNTISTVEIGGRYIIKSGGF